jgi:hypothetical protein
MGLTWSVASVVLSMAAAWLSPKIPRFGMLIACGKYEELDMLFWRTARLAVIFSVAGAMISWSAIFALNVIRHPIASRFLPLPLAGVFLLSQAVLAVTWPFSMYLRAHKKEPLLFLSVVESVSIGAATIVLGKQYSAPGIAAGYLLINMIAAPVVFIIWRRCKTEWHKAEYARETIMDDRVLTNEALS